MAGANELAGLANFRDPANGDYRFHYESAGIERGSNDVLNLTDVDYDQTAGLYGRRVDAGAFEYVPYAEIYVTAEGAYCPGDTLKAWYAVRRNAAIDGMLRTTFKIIGFRMQRVRSKPPLCRARIYFECAFGLDLGADSKRRRGGRGVKVMAKATRPYVAGHAFGGMI